jgi:hypothetical protein
MPLTINFYVDLSKQEGFRQLMGEQRIAQDLSFLLERAKEDRTVAFIKLGEIFLDMGRPDVAEAMKNNALTFSSVKEERGEGQAGKEVQLHFNDTCFLSLFVDLKITEKLTIASP